MARGLRKDTYDRIADARARNPLSLGPFLGALACKANLSAGQVGDIVDAHETTVFRWFFGQAEIGPPWALKVCRLLSLLAWMNEKGALPLDGSADDRAKLLVKYSREFEALMRGSSQQAARAT